MDIIRRTPLSNTQMGVYLECMENEQTLQYNIPMEYAFDARTNTAQLVDALAAVFSHYAAFTAGILVTAGVPELVQQRDAAVEPRCLEGSEADYAAFKQDFARPFAFDGTPLCRAVVYRTAQAVYALFDIHHLVYDGTSVMVFDDALKRAMEGRPLLAETVTLFDAVESEHAHADDPHLQESYDFFDELLGGVETDSNLLPDLADEKNGKCTILHSELGVSVADVARFARDRGVSENVVLLAGFSYVLAKYTGQREALFASVNNGRFKKPLDNTMGFFVRTFPLRFEIDEESSVRAFVAQVKERYVNVMRHDDASFSELAARYGVRADVKYVYQGSILGDLEIDGLPVKKTFLDCDDAQSNLDVMVYAENGRYVLRTDYVTSLYSAENIQQFLRLYGQVVREMLHVERLRDMQLVCPEDQAFLDAFNATDFSYDRTQTVWDIALEQVCGTAGECADEAGAGAAGAGAAAERPAVCFKDRAISYAEFDELTARLANYLVKQGIGRDDFVAVLIPRNEYMVITAWGVVRAGAAYQPLDPTYPQDRLNFMVQDSCAKLVIADRALLSLLSEYEGPVLYTDEIAALPLSACAADASAGAEAGASALFGARGTLDAPDAALGIVYTSGTTGRPKGCVLENRNIVCFYYHHRQVMGLTRASRVATYASFGFDAGIMDVFTTIMAGATLFVVPDEMRLDIYQLNDFYCENAITHGFITTQVGRMFAQVTTCETLEALLVGGEKLVPFTPPRAFDFINGYGPSESIAYVCQHTVRDDSSIQPIGTPGANTKLYVVDPYLRLLPAGACGELCIAGEQVGRGYLNLPEKTAAAFVENPFAEPKAAESAGAAAQAELVEPGSAQAGLAQAGQAQPGYERMYRTGDVVRILPAGSGTLDFVGRRDAQIKVRGFRVELTEIEQVIREFPPVADATVAAFDAPAGGKFIAAYVVGIDEIDVAALGEFIAERKPAYMVPEVTMQLEAIPLNANGKVDKRKLPKPKRQFASIVPPSNDVQQRIFDKAADVLGTTEFGVTTSLFEAGLTSIGVIRLNVALSEEFDVSLTIKNLRENATVEALEALIEAQHAEAAEVAGQVEGDFPLSKNQEGIYVECISNPGSTVYNIPLLLKIGDALDEGKLRRALCAAVNAHAYLLTRLFTNEQGTLRQRAGAVPAFAESDIADVRVACIEDAKDELVQPFDLLGERLFRMALVHAAGDGAQGAARAESAGGDGAQGTAHAESATSVAGAYSGAARAQTGGLYLFFDVHHIIADGTSVAVFLEDVSRAYRGEPLKAESFTGYDVAQAEAAAREGEHFADAQKHYDELLNGIDTDFMLGDDVRPETPRGTGSLERVSSTERFEAVRAYCAREGIGANGLMNAVFGYVLAKYNASDYSVFTTVYNGRSDSRCARTFGMLVKTLPVVVNSADAAAAESESTQGTHAAQGAHALSPADLARRVADQLIDSMVSDVFSFAEISRSYGVRSDVMFIFQGDSFEFDEFCGAPAREISVQLSDNKSPLSVQVFCKDGRFSYLAEYDAERLSESLVGAFVDAFDYALGQFISKKRLADVELVSAQMREKMDAFNATEVPFDDSRTMAGWFEQTAAQYADHTAVVCEGRALTYAQLDDYTARVACYLQSRGIGSGQFVGVLVNRNEYMAIGAYGVLRAGAAYEPLDPTYPPERLRFMLQNAGAPLVIADRDLAHLIEKDVQDAATAGAAAAGAQDAGGADAQDAGGATSDAAPAAAAATALSQNIEILYTDQIASLPVAPADFSAKAQPDDPFIIVYTSGTTGTPKGNVLSHRQPVALMSYHIKDAALTAQSASAYYTSFSFDAGMLDFHASLLSGGTLYVVPEALRLDLGALDRFFCENGITHGCMTTQMGSMFVAMTSCESLRYFMVGGEKLVPFVPPAHVRFLNGYGPSECTVYVSHYRVTDDFLIQPIGKPVDNLKFYIVDAHGHRLPIGAAGELCVAGKQVGLGYLHLPEKTAEVFKANPFSSEPGYERLYHTGDVVRELPDGNYDFVGRKDGQVKIRGFRVELTEIEQVVRRFEGVSNATVQAFDDPAGGKYLAAFVVSDAPVDFDAVSAFIVQSKPPYMVPAAYMQLDAIPLTQNGKVDKRALPRPKRAARTMGVEAANATEQVFCNIFGEVLGLSKVYADDDFFAVGGSSISAVQVVVKCATAGYNVVFKNLFENPTPQLLAQFVGGGSQAEDILAPAGAEKDRYDYSCLANNVIDNLRGIAYHDVGDVLLTGLTGFLGAHVYRELMEATDGTVTCLVRPKTGLSAQERFELTVTYYFEDWYNESHAARTRIIEGDLDDDELAEKLAGVHFDTIINTAANVKHFDKAENLVRDNFESVERLIELAVSRNARLVQASSASVCGESVNGSIPRDFRFKETDLNIGQSLENKYVYSKYLAEQAIIDATSRGRVRGRIVRLGNLAARDSDGEFQINPSNSGLLKLLQGYIKLGCYPVDMMDAGIEFSPIDKVAQALVLLAGVPDEYTVFHAMNCHTIHYGYLIHSLNACGHAIDIVEREEFESRFKQALEAGGDVTDFTGFVAYLNRTDESVADAMTHSSDEVETHGASGGSAVEAAGRTDASGATSGNQSAESAQGAQGAGAAGQAGAQAGQAESHYETRVKISSDASYTTKALYRLGFSWPLTSKEYLDSIIAMLDDKAFF